MKIQKISVQNLKAISEQELTLNGASCIVMAGNNAGKSTLLRALIDRFQGRKPEIVLNTAAVAGSGGYRMELTDGAVIEWNFTDKTEKFAYTDATGKRTTTGVLSAISEKYFGKKFDIDNFLASAPKAQSATLQKLVGLDFTGVDARYKAAFEARTKANATLDSLRAQVKGAPKPTPPVDSFVGSVEEIQAEIREKNAQNAAKLSAWKEANAVHRAEIDSYNETQRKLTAHKDKIRGQFAELVALKERFAGGIGEYIDLAAAKAYGASLQNGAEIKPLTDLPAPELLDTTLLQSKIEQATKIASQLAVYKSEQETYAKLVERGQSAAKEATAADKLVKDIASEKAEMIRGAKLPDGFSFSEDGELLYEGLVISDQQMSSSRKYIAGLKLGREFLGELEAMHFDAAPLTRVSLMEVQTWATANGLQLLIERPDFDATDNSIKYEII